MLQIKQSDLTIRLAGTSMTPALQPGDQLHVSAQDEIVAGDIAVCDIGSRWIAHRVVLAGRNGLVTKPEAVEHYDSPVPWERVLGKVTAAYGPNGTRRDISYVAEGTNSELAGPGRGTAAILAWASGRHVLDLGTGSGETARYVLMATQGCEVVAVDWNDEALDTARIRSESLQGFQCVKADASCLPFAEGTFDCVLLYKALHHFEFPWRGLDEARRVLRPGGALVVVEHSDRLNKVLRHLADISLSVRQYGSHPDPFVYRELRDQLAQRFRLDRVSHYEQDVLFIATKPAAAQTGGLQHD